MVYANRHLPKLSRPHSIPRPMMVSSLMLTLGIVLGYAYFIIFNLTFRDCDILVDALNPQEVCLFWDFYIKCSFAKNAVG
jgi:hypothetical protein